MATRDSARGSQKKQAVVLIHGIGEQRPMETLRGFVRAVWETDPRFLDPSRPKRPADVWSKPDKASGNLELRRLTTRQDRNRVRTDFFEFYWAHMMEGNAMTHVVAWARMLILRRPWTLPRHLRPLWWSIVLLLAVAVGLLAWSVIGVQGDQEPWFKSLPFWAKIFGALATSAVGGFLTRKVGDAARYLNASPPNIKSRAAIRQAGIALLRTLHDSGDYDRIIIVGHSLGSVIGYDILTHAWPEFNQQHDKPERPARPVLREFERYLAVRTDDDGRPLPAEDLDENTDPLDPAHLRGLQARTHEELRRTGCGWLVTDFVTLGSPLAHAGALLATSPARLRDKINAREFPACPPVLEYPHRNSTARTRRLSWRSKYMAPIAKRGRSISVPHHAAVFAATRWTNLYFPRRWLLWGDFVGGEIAPVLGPAVRDVPVRTKRWFGLFSHTTYWWMPADGNPDPGHIAALRDAVNLLNGRTS